MTKPAIATHASLEPLLAEVADARRRLADARAALPAEPVSDVVFDAPGGARVALSALFGDRRELIVIHNMGRGCPWCTMWADGFEGLRPHIESRAPLVVASPDAPDDQAAFAAARGWGFRMVSTRGTTFTADMGFEPEPGRVWPGMSAFTKRDDGTIERTGLATFGPGDDFCAAWPMFDLLHGGRGGWTPKLAY